MNCGSRCIKRVKVQDRTAVRCLKYAELQPPPSFHALEAVVTHLIRVPNANKLDVSVCATHMETIGI